MQTDKLMVLDTSPYASREEAQAQDVVLRNKDANALFESSLLAQLQEVCEREGITYGFKDHYIEARNESIMASGGTPQSLGSTEMGRIIVASEGQIQGTTLQIPTTGYHTTAETASVSSITKMLDLLIAFYKVNHHSTAHH